MYDLVSYVKRGKVRKMVLTNIERPSTPTELSIKLNIHRSAVSRALIELETKKLVQCVTPDEKMGRLYKLTEKGEIVLKEI